MSAKREISAQEALKRLKEGNERFLRGEAHLPGLPRETEGRVKCVGTIYEIETGRVRFLEA